MRRREFVLTFAGLGVSGWPTIASAQQAAKSPTIGFMGAGTPAGWKDWTSAFQQRIRELGWVEGRNLMIEYGWAEGSADRYLEIASEFAKLKVDVIVTVGGDAAKQATSTIPIVVAMMPDPVGTGLVTSLARPGGNLTGLSIRANDLAGKRIELLKEVIPGLRRLTVLASRGYSANLLELNEVLTSTKTFDLEALIVEVGQSEEIATAIAAFKDHTEALYVPANPFANTNRVLINEMALAARLPTAHGFRPYVESGGLMSYGPNTPDLFRRAGDYVDRILRGAKPGDLPIEQPTKFDLIINLKTAKALGLAVPPTVLARADEVIE
jgi:putative ABC transport system substrate-binding protein